MTYDEKIRWLRRYQESLRREKELAQEVERLHSEAYRVTPLISGMPGGASDGQALPRAVEGIIKAKQELECQINTCGAIRREIVAAIEQVTDARDHEILRRRYLLGQKWEEISVEMHYAYQHACERHKRAVCKMVIESDTRR